MLRIFGRAIVAIAALIALLILHYTLPDREIVRIVGVNTQRMDLGDNAFFFSGPAVGTAVTADGTRDVLFINGIDARGRPRVFRNEDTGWAWPPYFKVNSFSLQARASDLISTFERPRWVVVTHYGWRSELLTIFPNAIRLREVASPDVPLIPWLNMGILALLALGIFGIVRMLVRLRERTLDPMFDAAGDRIGRMRDRAAAARRNARTFRGRLAARLGVRRR